MTLHALVGALAILSVGFAARFPGPADARASFASPTFALSGVAGGNAQTETFFRPGTSQQTRESTVALVTRPDVSTLRAAGAISPATSFSSGVAVVAAASGEQGAGVKSLADIIDPQQPFVLYEVQPGDSASLVAQKYGIKLRTLLDNNPVVHDDALIKLGQTLIVPRKDGILHKVGLGETVAKIADQYDNITAGAIVEYRPNAISDPKSLEAGKYLLLVGATVKPPPPPPPPPPARPGASGPIAGSGAKPLPGGTGRFAFPLAAWRGVSDAFGTSRGGGTIHTGIDLDLYGYHHSNIFSSCAGVVSRVEYLTYSYGYHVIVDCGDGWTTLYAHMSQINVTPGARVGQGTVLGVSGVTGYTTGEHLHFEIRYNNGVVNPALYLPF